MRIAIAAALLMLSAPGPLADAQAERRPVSLALVLALDASSSIDGAQFDLQISGFADAFRHPEVHAAIAAHLPEGIAVTVVQWSASFQQVQTVPWSHIDDRASASAFAAAIETNMRQFTGFGTAIGSAIAYAVGLFETGDYVGRRRVIDVLADERANTGSHPSYTREAARAAGIIINGLAITTSAHDLERYFETHVISGPDAFVMTVDRYDDLAVAIRRKLIRELGGATATIEMPAARAAAIP